MGEIPDLELHGEQQVMLPEIENDHGGDGADDSQAQTTHPAIKAKADRTIYNRRKSRDQARIFLSKYDKADLMGRSKC